MSAPTPANSGNGADSRVGVFVSYSRVDLPRAQRIVAALEKNGLPVTSVVYPDEGHGFARPENRIDFYARAELFLSKCLGSRVEPLPKDGKVAGSTAVAKVVTGKK